MKRWGIVFIILVLAGVFTLDLTAPSVVRSKIFENLSESCPACDLKIGKITTSLLLLSAATFVFENVDFKGDPKDSTTFGFSAARIEIHFKPISLLFTPVITKLEISRPHVTVGEVENSTPVKRPDFPPPGYALKGFPEARVGVILVHDGSFTYELKVYGQNATIDLSNIQAETNDFVTRADLLTEDYRHDLTVQTTAQLEKSGSVVLNFSMDPFAKKNHDKILIEVKGLPLAEMSGFFKKEDGIDLSGTLAQARADMNLSEGHLTGEFQTSYQDVKFDYHATPDRKAISSFLKTTLQSLTTAKTQPKKGEAKPPVKEIQAQRLPREPITKFLLRGLKDAVQKILTS